jgi:hypothetical protein
VNVAKNDGEECGNSEKEEKEERWCRCDKIPDECKGLKEIGNIVVVFSVETEVQIGNLPRNNLGGRPVEIAKGF